MNIEPIIGMNPSVQVSASEQLVYPGEEVTLNGRGASIFVWNTDDGTVHNYSGPQLTIHPKTTTVVTTAGSGLELCNKTATTTIYIRENVAGADDGIAASSITLYPNPGQNILNIAMENSFRGDVRLQVQSIIGTEIYPTVGLKKQDEKLIHTINTSSLSPGIYFIKIDLAGKTVIKKWIKS
jgi:hypothetical protein